LIAPPVAVIAIAPALPPRALASVCALPPLAVMPAAAGVVIVTEAPVIVTLPASVPWIEAPCRGRRRRWRRSCSAAVVVTLPEAWRTTLPPLPLAPPAVLIDAVCRLPALLPTENRAGSAGGAVAGGGAGART
jgi:hypothetical protein